MASRKGKGVVKKLVWRISDSAPMGEWIDPDAPTEQRRAIEPPRGNWAASSFDLMLGSEVTDDPAAQPDTLWDEYFGPGSDAPAADKK